MRPALLPQLRTDDRPDGAGDDGSGDGDPAYLRHGAGASRHPPSSPHLFPGVPSMYMAVNNFPGARRYGIRRSGPASPARRRLPVEVQEAFEKLTRGRLVEGYGQTEASPVTHANPLYGRRKVGCDRHPGPSTEAKIVDLATGQDLPPGQIGELAVRGPQVMLRLLGPAGGDAGRPSAGRLAV